MQHLLQDLLDLSIRGRGRVLAVTVLGVTGTVGIALLSATYVSQFMGEPGRSIAFAMAWSVSLLLATPTFYVFADALRRAAVSQGQLALLASHDGLTTCLNRGAFVALVDALLVRGAIDQLHGALLMVDADRFKSINDRFGHPAGDRALQLIATAIRGSVRSTDLVGRVGGEEFGVFLPRVKPDQVSAIAERIRTAVADIEFAPKGRTEPLTVSIGAVFFERPVAFDALFSVADRLLYDAKRAGRNRVQMEMLPAEG